MKSRHREPEGSGLTYRLAIMTVVLCTLAAGAATVHLLLRSHDPRPPFAKATERPATRPAAETRHHQLDQLRADLHTFAAALTYLLDPDTDW